MIKETRSYKQYCPLARSLDIVGERWTLLIVRELLTGPKRFKDLQSSLKGIGTNLLSSRLRDMERNALVLKATLPPPGVAAVYELTEHGRKLDETLGALVRWGIPLLAIPKKQDDYFMPHWAIQGMLSAFYPSEALGVSEEYEFNVDDEIFHVRVHEGRATGGMGKGYAPTLVWASDSASFLALAFKMMSPEKACAKGFVKTGELECLTRYVRIFDPTRIDAT